MSTSKSLRTIKFVLPLLALISVTILAFSSHKTESAKFATSTFQFTGTAGQESDPSKWVHVVTLPLCPLGTDRSCAVKVNDEFTYLDENNELQIDPQALDDAFNSPDMPVIAGTGTYNVPDPDPTYSAFYDDIINRDL
ncbi:hypothetical protein GCM10027051_32560 [Niabella terrae]